MRWLQGKTTTRKRVAGSPKHSFRRALPHCNHMSPVSQRPAQVWKTPKTRTTILHECFSTVKTNAFSWFPFSVRRGQNTCFSKRTCEIDEPLVFCGKFDPLPHVPPKWTILLVILTNPHLMRVVHTKCEPKVPFSGLKTRNMLEQLPSCPC